MSSSATGGAEGGGGGGGGAGSSQIGYCHTCDRQVSIDPVSFECSQCGGGFVELFDIDQQREAAAAAAANAATGGNGAQPRVIRLNNQNLSNLGDVLPLFLQMLNPAMAGMGQPPMGSMQPGMGMRTSSETSQSGVSGGGDSGETGYMRPGTTTTRFQVILPTQPHEAGHDQFDLYGVINNVINDLLDPRRTQPGGGQNMFHFQAPPIRIINLHSDARDYAWGAGGLDAIITQLLNQLENTGPPPASQDQLINLPVITISQEQVEMNAQCAICMEDFNLNEKAKKLPCKHLFHEPCISEWLKLHGTCPVCRKNLNGEDTSQREYISRPPPPNQANSTNSADAATDETPSTSNTATNDSAAPTNPDNSSSSSRNNPSNESNTNSRNPHFYDPDFD